MEIREAVPALDFVDAELDLAEGVFFVVLQVGERDFDNAALEGVVGVFETGGSVDEGLADAVYCIRISRDGREMIPYSVRSKVLGARTEYQSFLEKGSTVRFLRPFLPFERRLFFPTAMLGGGWRMWIEWRSRPSVNLRCSVWMVSA